MRVADEQRSWFEELLNAGASQLPGNELAWLRQAREHARQALSELPVPNRKQESWRYSGIDALLKNRFEATAGEFTALQALNVDAWLLPSHDAWRVVFVNGHYVAHLSSAGDLPAGATAGNLRAALATDPDLLECWFGQTANHSHHLFTALNTALANDGVFIHIKPGVEIERPIEVIHLNLAHTTPVLMQPRNLILLEAGAKATLVERFIGAGDVAYFHNNLTEIVVGTGASLAHYRLQDENRSAYHLSSLYLAQEENSRYRSTTLAFGGAWARTDYNASLRHEGAECVLNGLYTVGDRQLSDFHLDVRHSVPGCVSREQFKGILYGKGRAVFDGRILVDKQAQHSDAHLSNDNLMLTRDAEVDTKPQLEIYADDVKCSHGTTVGQLEPQQLFYLRSRGIDATSARKMLCLGFAGEIIDTVEVPALRDYIAERLDVTLKQAALPPVQG